MGFTPSPIEIAMIAVLALILLGPQRLPEAAKSLGNGLREMRDSFQGQGRDDELNLEDHDAEDDDEDEDGDAVAADDGESPRGFEDDDASGERDDAGETPASDQRTSASEQAPIARPAAPQGDAASNR